MRRIAVRVTVILVFALFVLGASIGLRIVAYDSSSATGTFDAAIVLGAAVTNGLPSPVFEARIDHGIDLYRQGTVSRLIFTGGVGMGDLIAEGDAGADYAKAQGVPDSAILVERKSKTTLQNLEGAKEVMDKEGIGSVLIVSDPLHLRRSVITARWLGMTCAPAATPYSRYKTWKTKFPFLLREIYFSIHFRLFRH